MTISAHLVHGGQRVPVPAGDTGDEPVLVPSANILLEIEGDGLPLSVILDGRPVQLVTNESRTRGYIQLDLFRSVGFHHLLVVDSHFLFATQDAKLRLDGVLSMLEYVEAEGLSWGSQLFFADGLALRHPKVDFAWLSKAGPAIQSIAHSVAQRPARRVEASPRPVIPGSGRLMLHETLALLRRSPKTLLEEHPEGPLHLSNRRFMPRIAIMASSASSVDITANRRLTWLLNACVEMADSLRTVLPDAQRQQIRRLRTECLALLDRFPFSQLTRTFPKLPETPTREELIDERYQQSFRYFEELSTGLGWQPGTHLATRSAYVAYADEIYQAFVALCLARAFGAVRTRPAMVSGLEHPMFHSEEYDIYYDTTPPKSLLANWRDLSSRPSPMRPDLMVVHLPTRRGILLDAKYRVEAAGRAPSSALNECQVYMHSFARDRIAMCYPGERLEVTEVSGGGKTIIEIPITPVNGLEEYLRLTVRPRIEAFFEPLNP